MGRKRKQIKCDRDCLHCLYPEYPPSCSELPMTKWEADAMKIAHSDLFESRTPEQEREHKRLLDFEKRAKRQYAEEQACITQAREARGWRQHQLAAIIGVSKSVISDWERGVKRCKWEALYSVFPELEKKRKAATRGRNLQLAANQKNHVHYT